ncbi:Hypothetical predicted protein [Mytilus galloprovincialis]|uniref:C2H2-type domain-containing protein n=1 Tax=Mytilus galloprovincialis TaxID=29158 RepID=A0A8B6F6G4_MYTGA|nr:Hypothetical predicted protein [Mytilus galloprovincialis]
MLEAIGNNQPQQILVSSLKPHVSQVTHKNGTTIKGTLLQEQTSTTDYNTATTYTRNLPVIPSSLTITPLTKEEICEQQMVDILDDVVKTFSDSNSVCSTIHVSQSMQRVINDTALPESIPQSDVSSANIEVKCKFCSFTTPSKSTMEDHITCKHPHSCVACNKVFVTKSGIMKHEKKYHGPQANLKTCDVCYAKFSYRSELRQHMNSHNKNCRKTYGCGFCNKTYEKRTDLADHIDYVHHSK